MKTSKLILKIAAALYLILFSASLYSQRSDTFGGADRQTINPFSQSVAAGGNFSLFVCENGTVTATGSNNVGQLGSGDNTNTVLPVPVFGLTDVVAVAARDVFALFLKSDGTVWGTGGNSNGELGNGTILSTNTPIQITSLSGIVKIAAGIYHSLFLKNDRTVWACGRNYSGAVGNGNQIQQNIPVQVLNLEDIVDIAAGDYHSMFLSADGTVKSCGDNSDSALGTGLNLGWAVTTPTTIAITGVTAIAAGTKQSTFIKADGTVWACGLNYYGKLGFGGTTFQTLPGQVSNLTGIIASAGGQYHNLFLKNDGTAWACGLNSSGQLGDGTNIDRPIPVQVINVQNITGIATSGYYHSLLSTSDNTFYAFGEGGGKLGIGNTATQLTPVLVIDNCTALGNETFESYKFSAYPNPSDGLFNIKSNQFFENVTLRLIDLSGRIIFSKEAYTPGEPINITTLKNGIYIINLITDNKTYLQKIIKN